MREKRIWKNLYTSILSVFLLIGCCFLIIGTAYARYQYTTTRSAQFKVRTAANFKITTGNFTQEDDGMRYTFQVGNNGNAKDTYFYLRVAASLGVKLDGAKVSLIVKNINDTEKSYEGKETAIIEGSALYEEMGDGYEYVFYDTNGHELSWKLPGGDSSSQEFIIEVDKVVNYSIMDIIVTETGQNE